MAEEPYCKRCGAPLANHGANIVPLRTSPAAGPPQLDIVDVGRGKVRLRVNLVIPRETAIRVITQLAEAD
jgi:hypothetical protein